MPGRIMIVDDAAFIRMMLKDILSKNGFEIVGQAENGLKAIDEYKDLKPDLVLMDITMPELNGVEATKKIREMDPGARIVICSALAQAQTVLEAIQAGARDYIVKPFEEEKVIRIINKCLKD